jgi:phosphoribosylformimino-5-aminoimidazole carboxamide ribotide isomerase
MDVIPVIDVQHGIAVRATGGRRADYQPLKTPLATENDPVAVALGFRSLYSFAILYVADLDGIEGRGRNMTLPRRLADVLPGVELWIDDGSSACDAAARLVAEPNTTMVIGSESLDEAGAAALRDIRADRYVLSLDFKDDRFVGPPSVLENAEHWPDRVIAMTLARVGSEEGPDLNRIANLVARADCRRVYAAGGVRECSDIKALREAGAAGVLVATALHAGKITAGDLEGIASR